MTDTYSDSGDSGMLLIGADGSIKLHGGSSIFSGDNQTQHSLLAQRNPDGTMNVYMVPNDGPNKGKMFMVMPSSNGGSDGKGWKMASLDDGKTILTPTYKENPPIYVPLSVAPPQFGDLTTATPSLVSSISSSLTTNTTSPAMSQTDANLQNLPPSSKSEFSFLLPTFLAPVPSTTTGPSNVTSSSVMSDNTATVKVTTSNLTVSDSGTIDSTVNPLPSVRISTSVGEISAAQIVSNPGSLLIQNTSVTVSEVSTTDSDSVVSNTSLRPMLLFTHEAAANLGKNSVLNSGVDSRTNSVMLSSSTNVVSSHSTNVLCTNSTHPTDVTRLATSTMCVASSTSGRILYPVLTSKPNILSKVKPTIIYPSKTTQNAFFAKSPGAGLVTQAGNASKFISAAQIKQISPSVSGTLQKSNIHTVDMGNIGPPIVSIKPSLAGNVTSSTANRIPIVVFPNSTAPVNQKPKIIFTTAVSKPSNGGFISLLPVSKSSAKVISPVASFSTDRIPSSNYNVPVAVATKSKSGSDANKSNQPYVISLRLQTPTSSQQSVATHPTKTILSLTDTSSGNTTALSTPTSSFSTNVYTQSRNNSHVLTNASAKHSAPFLPRDTEVSNVKTTKLSNNKAKPFIVNPSDLLPKCLDISVPVSTVSTARNNVSTVLSSASLLPTNTAGNVLKNVVRRAFNNVISTEYPKMVYSNSGSNVDIPKDTSQRVTGTPHWSDGLASTIENNDTKTHIAPVSLESDELPIRIDSVFSLNSQDDPQSEDTDSADECTDVIEEHVSENFSSEISEKSPVIQQKCIDDNILNLMKSVAMPKEVFTDHLLNSQCFVVLDSQLPKISKKCKNLNTWGPCSRKCRERFIRQQELKKKNDLEYKIAALKTRIRDKKWKNRRFRVKKKRKAAGNKVSNKTNPESSTVSVSSIDDVEMPQLEAASPVMPVLSPVKEREMPDLLNSPTMRKISSASNVNTGENYSNIPSSKTNITPDVSPLDHNKNKQYHHKLSLPVTESKIENHVSGQTFSFNSKIAPAGVTNFDPSKVPISRSILDTQSSLSGTANNIMGDNSIPSAVAPNTKFYLIKVDDKSILIPAVNTGTQPRAYILDPQSQASNKIIPGNTGIPDLRLVVPSSSATSKLHPPTGNTWSNPQSVDPNKVSIMASSMNVANSTSNIQAYTQKQVTPSTTESCKDQLDGRNTFGNVAVKQEPVTSGYGDETVSTIPKIKKEKYRGYSDETPPDENSLEHKHALNIKRLNVEKGDGSGNDHTPSKIKKLDNVKNEEDRAKEEAEKEKRIKNLKEMLKKQEMALEEIRRKRFTETPPDLSLD